MRKFRKSKWYYQRPWINRRRRFARRDVSTRSEVQSRRWHFSHVPGAFPEANTQGSTAKSSCSCEIRRSRLSARPLLRTILRFTMKVLCHFQYVSKHNLTSWKLHLFVPLWRAYCCSRRACQHYLALWVLPETYRYKYCPILDPDGRVQPLLIQQLFNV